MLMLWLLLQLSLSGRRLLHCRWKLMLQLLQLLIRLTARSQLLKMGRLLDNLTRDDRRSIRILLRLLTTIQWLPKLTSAQGDRMLLNMSGGMYLRGFLQLVLLLSVQRRLHTKLGLLL